MHFFLLILIFLFSTELFSKENIVLSKPKMFAHVLYQVDKKEYRQITEWSGSGFVSPPTIDIKTTVQNESNQDVNHLIVHFDIFTKIGPLVSDPKHGLTDINKGLKYAKWNLKSSYTKNVTVSIKKHQQVDVEWKNFSIENMYIPLFDKDKWPYEIKIVVTTIMGKKRYVSEQIIPIMPGD